MICRCGAEMVALQVSLYDEYICDVCCRSVILFDDGEMWGMQGTYFCDREEQDENDNRPQQDHI
jgi:hypothetical protein